MRAKSAVFLDVTLHERRDGALLLATSGYMAAAVDARGELHTNYLRFGDGDKIAMTCRNFARKRDDLWMAPQPFKTFMLDSTV